MFKVFHRALILISILILSVGCMPTMPYLKKPIPFVVQFNSFCCGVPDQKPIRDAIHQVLINEGKSGILAWKLSPMGKEGEYWICFQTDRTFRSLKHKLIDAIDTVAKQPQERGGITLDSNFILNQSSIPQHAKWESIWFE